MISIRTEATPSFGDNPADILYFLIDEQRKIDNELYGLDLEMDEESFQKARDYFNEEA